MDRNRNEALVLGPPQPHVQLLAVERHIAALSADREARDGRSQVAQVLPEEDGRGRGRDRRQRELGAAHLEANLLEPAVTQRALCERRNSAFGRVYVELYDGARSLDDDALLAE